MAERVGQESAFQSMQDSLDKIAIATAEIAKGTRTQVEEEYESNKAQKIRDKEQTKQTTALEKVGKNQKDDQGFFSKHWGKLLILLGLMYVLWNTKLKTLEDFARNMKNAFDWIMDNPWKAAGLTAGVFTAAAAMYKGAKTILKSVAKKAIRTVTPKAFHKTLNVEAKQPTKISNLKVEKTQIETTRKEIKLAKAAEVRKQTVLKTQFINERIKSASGGKITTEKSPFWKEVSKPESNMHATRTKPIHGPGTSPITNSGGANLDPKMVKQSIESSARIKKVAVTIEKNIKSADDAVKKMPKSKIGAAGRLLTYGFIANEVANKFGVGANFGVLPSLKRDDITDELKFSASDPDGKFFSSGFDDPNKSTSRKVTEGLAEGLWEMNPATIAIRMKESADAEKKAKTKADLDKSKSSNTITFMADGKLMEAWHPGGGEGIGDSGKWPTGTEIVELAGKGLKKIKKILFGDKADGAAGAERLKTNVAKQIALNPDIAELIHISGAAFDARGKTQRITSGFRNAAAQRKAMEAQRLGTPKQQAQYKRNYSLGGTLTPSDTSTATWMSKRLSKHQHGNAIDIAYPKGYNKIEQHALVDEINAGLSAKGLYPGARHEIDHIHLGTGHTPSLKEAQEYEKLFTGVTKFQVGAGLKQLHDVGSSIGGGNGSGITVNNIDNSQKINKTDSIIASGNNAQDPMAAIPDGAF